MEVILLWLVLAVVVAVVAGSKGRNPVLWGLYGFLIWPVALVHILVSRPTAKAAAHGMTAAGRAPCPHCAEPIMRAASVCPHCNRGLDTGWAEPKAPPPKAAPPKPRPKAPPRGGDRPSDDRFKDPRGR